jgi:phosphopantetheinyl transferase (holo-ACP synthase)
MRPLSYKTGGLLSCGVDITNKRRMKMLLERGAAPLWIFNANELKDIAQNEDLLCGYFTFKEAFLKAFGSSWLGGPVGADEIEVSITRPTLTGQSASFRFFGRASEAFLKYGYSSVKMIFSESNGNVTTGVIMSNQHGARIIRSTGVARVCPDTRMVSFFGNKQSAQSGEHDGDIFLRRQAVEAAGRAAAHRAVAGLLKKGSWKTAREERAIEIVTDRDGRPVIANPGCFRRIAVPVLSISYTKDCAVCLAAAFSC